jgi:ribosomal protein L3
VKSVPVTLIEATPNRITQVKTVENDGYNAPCRCRRAASAPRW